MDMFITLIVVMVSQVYVYVQTHQIVYIKYVQVFFVYQLYLNVPVKKRKRTRKYSEVLLLLCVCEGKGSEIWDLKFRLRSYWEELYMLHKGVCG